MSPSAGSSPRGRGKRGQHGREARLVRLIPAWAGKTRPARSRRACPGAHPRVGGENPSSPRSVGPPGGSSPRGRGKRREADAARASHRLIPAWAGKTCSAAAVQRSFPAHPRVGGENTRAESSSRPKRGSSPRGRGKHPARLASCLAVGLIPAWAGKTALRRRRSRGLPAHPRVGGENVPVYAASANSGGSSPRGRGKRR